ncbi:MAG: hypothetical protein H0V76_10080 [Blastocatellia bacterium]|nr:hypothetical protein [Blastocatellia bacterium]
MELRTRTSGGCTGKQCGYNVSPSKSVGCDEGDGSCITAMMVMAEESDFHSSELQQASEDIQKIIDGIDQKGETRKLSFLATHRGIMLAWVEHDRPAKEGDLTASSDPADLEAALGIKSATAKAFDAV